MSSGALSIGLASRSIKPPQLAASFISASAPSQIRRLGAIFPPMPERLFQCCIPTRATKVPDGPDWFHEIKHDGYRLIVRRAEQ